MSEQSWESGGAELQSDSLLTFTLSFFYQGQRSSWTSVSLGILTLSGLMLLSGLARGP